MVTDQVKRLAMEMEMARARATTMKQMRNGQMVMARVVVVGEIELQAELEQVW